MPPRRKANTIFFPNLVEHGLKEHEVGGGGDCLFRALADQRWGDRNRHGEAREIIVDFLRENEDHFAPFMDYSQGSQTSRSLRGNPAERFSSWDDYVTRMSKPGTWGDQNCIVAFCGAEDVQIRVWCEGHDNLQRFNDQPGTTTLHIANLQDTHFWSVRHEDGPQEGIPNTQHYLEQASANTGSEQPSASQETATQGTAEQPTTGRVLRKRPSKASWTEGPETKVPKTKAPTRKGAKGKAAKAKGAKGNVSKPIASSKRQKGATAKSKKASGTKTSSPESNKSSDLSSLSDKRDSDDEYQPPGLRGGDTVWAGRLRSRTGLNSTRVR